LETVVIDREACLIYFRQAIGEPLSVPPWSEWWAANEELVSASFPLVDYVRLKHRRLLGAQQILQIIGELPPDFAPQSPLISGSCCRCGERFVNEAEAEAAGETKCSSCGIRYVFMHGPERE
jgi:DNA-directed RNA polymerase subunit RPC12/RpoP